MSKQVVLKNAFIFYRRFISPALQMAYGPSSGCRFSPTCSEYAYQVFQDHSIFIGFFLVSKRLLRCNPFGSWGVDMPPKKTEDFYPVLRALRKNRKEA